MTNHQLGMALTYTGVIGAQGSAGNPIDNAWNNPSFWVGTNYHTWTFNSVAATSTLYVQNSAIYYPTNNAGSPNPQSYAFGSVSLTTGAYSCGGGGSGSSMMQSNNLTSGSSSSVQLESISKDGSNYVAQNQLYRYLFNNPNAKTGNTQLQSFYNTIKTTNVGKLYDIENSLAGGNFILASSQINSVNPSNSIETNYKDFYALYNRFFNSGVLSSTDNLTLLNLCNKCPLTDGAIIYQARALYNVVNNTVESYIDNCPRNDNFNSRLIGMAGITESDYSWSANLYPNPASDELYIGTDLENEELNIQIIDVTGKVVTNENIRTKEFIGRLNLSLKDGIYFVTLTNKNKETIVKKLVISK